MKRILRMLLQQPKRVVLPPPPLIAMTSNNTPSPFVVSASSSFAGSFDSWYAYDGSKQDTGSFVWASDQIIPSFITIDFAANYLFSSVEITARNTNGLNQTPTAFDLQSSTDGSAFTTFYSQSGVIWSALETKIFSFTPLSARYMRVVGTASGSTLIAITEIKWN